MMPQNNTASSMSPVLAADFDEDFNERPHVGARYRTIHHERAEHRRDLTRAAHLISKGYIIGQE